MAARNLPQRVRPRPALTFTIEDMAGGGIAPAVAKVRDAIRQAIEEDEKKEPPVKVALSSPT
jgi:hypothetical protein